MSDPIDAARALAVRLGAPLASDAPASDVAAALAGLEPAADRPTRKEIRRALYRLSQAGIRAPAAPVVEPPPPILGPVIEAWVSAIDGRGDRLIWLVREQQGGELVLVAADVNEPAGLRDLRVFDVSRKQLRAMRDRFQAEAGLRFAAADWQAVDALVLEAQDRLAAPDRHLDYRRIRSRLTTLPPHAPAELVSSRVSTPDEATRPALVRDSAALLAEPELRTWWPRPDDAAPFLAEIRAVRESPLVLPPAQQEERLREVLARATRALYPAGSMARRLEATAFVLAETGRADAARRALAVAATLRASPDAEIPLLTALTHQGLGTHLAALEAERKQDREAALVRTPDELARAGSPSRPPRSRG